MARLKQERAAVLNDRGGDERHDHRRSRTRPSRRRHTGALSFDRVPRRRPRLRNAGVQNPERHVHSIARHPPVPYRAGTLSGIVQLAPDRTGIGKIPARVVESKGGRIVPVQQVVPELEIASGKRSQYRAGLSVGSQFGTVREFGVVARKSVVPLGYDDGGRNERTGPVCPPQPISVLVSHLGLTEDVRPCGGCRGGVRPKVQRSTDVRFEPLALDESPSCVGIEQVRIGLALSVVEQVIGPVRYHGGHVRPGNVRLRSHPLQIDTARGRRRRSRSGSRRRLLRGGRSGRNDVPIDEDSSAKDDAVRGAATSGIALKFAARVVRSELGEGVGVGKVAAEAGEFGLVARSVGEVELDLLAVVVIVPQRHGHNHPRIIVLPNDPLPVLVPHLHLVHAVSAPLHHVELVDLTRHDSRRFEEEAQLSFSGDRRGVRIGILRRVLLLPRISSDAIAERSRSERGHSAAKVPKGVIGSVLDGHPRVDDVQERVGTVVVQVVRGSYQRTDVAVSSVAESCGGRIVLDAVAVYDSVDRRTLLVDAAHIVPDHGVRVVISRQERSEQDVLGLERPPRIAVLTRPQRHLVLVAVEQFVGRIHRDARTQLVAIENVVRFPPSNVVLRIVQRVDRTEFPSGSLGVRDRVVPVGLAG
mmetsp:Transcript_2400/g.4185  ORF Transcript_2400/g.4185 Transcript_2400/m.4185 type:complete len:644 (+) Transcript_2400:453-2384(+)